MRLTKEKLKEITKQLDYIEHYEIFCAGRDCKICPFGIYHINCNNENLFKKVEILNVTN